MLKEITSSMQWDEFVLSLNPNTFLQSWEWGQVQKNDGEDVKYLGIFEADQLVGACLLLTVKARRGRHFFIPHGPILKNENSLGKYLREIAEFCRQNQSGEVALRISPLMLESQTNSSVFQKLGFRSAPMHVHAELTWVVGIDKSEDEVLNAMRKTTRQAIRKAEQAGVDVEIFSDSSALDRFWPLYQQTKDRHDFVPYSRKLLETQLQHMNAFTAIASHEGQDVAAGIFFQFGRTVFYYHGASIKTSSKVSPAQLLQWKAIKEAKRRGATRFNFWGIAPQQSEGPPKPWRRRAHPFEGITVFKTGFGGYALNYMHAQDLPLSWKYWKLWTIDTYRKIKRGF